MCMCVFMGVCVCVCVRVCVCVIVLESGRVRAAGRHTVAPTHPSTAHMRNALYADCIEKSHTAPHCATLPNAGRELLWSNVGTVRVRRFGDRAKGRERIIAIYVPQCVL